MAAKNIYVQCTVYEKTVCMDSHPSKTNLYTLINICFYKLFEIMKGQLAKSTLGHTKLMSCSTESPLWFLQISHTKKQMYIFFLTRNKIISGLVFSVYFVSGKHFRSFFSMVAKPCNNMLTSWFLLISPIM